MSNITLGTGEWVYASPVQLQVSVSQQVWNDVRLNLLSVPVNTITFYTQSRGSLAVPLDSDLMAIANLTGTNTIYYRAGDGDWQPVVIGSGLTFLTGTLTATGSISSLGPDLTALEALTGTNSIYYRSAANTWSPVTMGTGVNFQNSILDINKDSYCLEGDIGLVPYDFSNPSFNDIALQNTTKLNAALEAMSPSGQFTFVNGYTGPILKPISCPGRTYLFFGPYLRTNLKWGGALIGASAGAAEGDGSYAWHGIGPGGSRTRFVRTQASGVDGEYVFLLRNNGFQLENIDFFGNMSPGSIVAFTGSRTHTILGLEGRAFPPVGQHYVKGCNFVYGGTGIRFLSGYYSGITLIPDENHADCTTWEQCRVVNVQTAVRSENQQALNHSFNNCILTANSGGIIFDYQRGGLLYIYNLLIGYTHITLLRVKDYSPNNAYFDINFNRDGFGGTAHKLTLFEYSPAIPPEWWMKWNVHFHGNISTYLDAAYMTGGVANFNGIPSSGIWFRCTNLEFIPTPTGYYWDIHGPWQRLLLSGS